MEVIERLRSARASLLDPAPCTEDCTRPLMASRPKVHILTNQCDFQALGQTMTRQEALELIKELDDGEDVRKEPYRFAECVSVDSLERIEKERCVSIKRAHGASRRAACQGFSHAEPSILRIPCAFLHVFADLAF